MLHAIVVSQDRAPRRIRRRPCKPLSDASRTFPPGHRPEHRTTITPMRLTGRLGSLDISQYYSVPLAHSQIPPPSRLHQQCWPVYPHRLLHPGIAARNPFTPFTSTEESTATVGCARCHYRIKAASRRFVCGDTQPPPQEEDESMS